MKIIIKRRPVAVRRIGRSRIRREDEFKEDLGNMKIRNWGKMVTETEAWKRIVEQARTHKAKRRRRIVEGCIE